VVNNAELDEHKIEHGTLSGDSPIDFSGKIDLFLSLHGNKLLLLDLGRGLFGDLEGFNKCCVLQNGIWVGIGKLL